MNDSVAEKIPAYTSGRQADENYDRIWLPTVTAKGRFFAPLTFAPGAKDTRRAQRSVANDWGRTTDREVLLEFRRQYPHGHRKAGVWEQKPAASMVDAVARARDLLSKSGEAEYAQMLDALLTQRGLLDECHMAIWG